MLTSDIHIKRLSSAIKDDFYKVHRAGEYGDWCLCGYWWMESVEGWDKRTEEEGRAQREELFARGIEDGYILYENDIPVGWCQACQRDQLIHLMKKFNFAPDPDTWCISCFMIIPAARGKGLAHRFLTEVLQDMKARGVKVVQAYPRSESGLPANDVWTGPEALYIKAGFSRVRDLPGRTLWEISL